MLRVLNKEDLDINNVFDSITEYYVPERKIIDKKKLNQEIVEYVAKLKLEEEKKKRDKIDFKPTNKSKKKKKPKPKPKPKPVLIFDEYEEYYDEYDDYEDNY